MRSEPSVDADDVEAVAALRQHADLVAVGVLRQADSALAASAARTGCGGELLVVGVLRERLEDLLFEALVVLVGGSRAAVAGGAAAEPGASGDGD